jgi:DNA-binding MarR family transcriptional regulator
MRQPIAHDVLAMTEYGRAPSILVLADSEAGAARSCQAVENLGYRVADTAGVERGVDRLDRQAWVDAVMVDLAGEVPSDFDRTLAALEGGVKAGRFGAVVTAPLDLLDRVAAGAWSAEQLCDPAEPDLALALAKAAHAPEQRLSDVKGASGVSVQQLRQEVGRIATMLASLSKDEIAVSHLRGNGASEGARHKVDAGFVRAIIRARRLRDQFFNSDLFADPAWDMLLDLMAARLERQRVAVSSLCIAAAVPPTTALRWIKTLTDYGLFVRHADPQDGRRVYIELSDKGAAGLEAYLNAAQRISPLIV